MDCNFGSHFVQFLLDLLAQACSFDTDKCPCLGARRPCGVMCVSLSLCHCSYQWKEEGGVVLNNGIEFCTKFGDLNEGERTTQGTHYTRGPAVFFGASCKMQQNRFSLLVLVWGFSLNMVAEAEVNKSIWVQCRKLLLWNISIICP